MFHSRLLWRLYSGYAAIIVISVLVVGILLSRQLEENTLKEIQDSLSVRSALLTEIARDSLLTASTANSNSSFQSTLTKLGNSTASRLTVIAADGHVIADSQEQPQAM